MVIGKIFLNVQRPEGEFLVKKFGFGREGGRGPEAEIVETTFRSPFRFRFLKYPLFKNVVSFLSGT